jgi:hypothetical protein
MFQRHKTVSRVVPMGVMSVMKKIHFLPLLLSQQILRLCFLLFINMVLSFCCFQVTIPTRTLFYLGWDFPGYGCLLTSSQTRVWIVVASATLVLIDKRIVIDHLDNW